MMRLDDGEPLGSRIHKYTRPEIVCTAARKLEGRALVDPWRGSPDQTNGRESEGGRWVNYMWRRLVYGFPFGSKILFGETRVCAPYCDAFPRGQNVTGFRLWFNRGGVILDSELSSWKMKFLPREFCNSVSTSYQLVRVYMYIYIYLYGSFIYDLSRQNLNPYIIIEFFSRI